MLRYSTYFLIAISVIFVLASCFVYGPETEQKSSLDIINKDNYQPAGSVLGIPVLKTTRRSTVIRGSSFITEFIPLKFEKLKLIDIRGKTISETTTSYNGTFEFSDYIINGEYLIKIDSQKYSGETRIIVDSYHLENINIKAEPNQ